MGMGGAGQHGWGITGVETGGHGEGRAHRTWAWGDMGTQGQRDMGVGGTQGQGDMGQGGRDDMGMGDQRM